MPTTYPKPTKPLRQWNGRPHGVLRQNQWEGYHLNVAAYSAADARRVCLEAGFADPGHREITNYWNDCWGISMANVPVERGLWIDQNGVLTKMPLDPGVHERMRTEALDAGGSMRIRSPASLRNGPSQGEERLRDAMDLLRYDSAYIGDFRVGLLQAVRKFAVYSGDLQLEAACDSWLLTESGRVSETFDTIKPQAHTGQPIP